VSTRPLPQALTLEGRRVLVTGAASGIGQSASACLAELGAQMVLTDRSALEETAARVAQAGGVQPVCIRGDLTDADLQARAAYAASKGGVHTLVRWLSRRAVGHGVLVNGVAPGIVATPLSATLKVDTSILPMKRVARPEELGWPIALLCTPAASFTSGAILDVNGGMFVG
jgi:NAD(P)-dependent dehydrogenase (short-subunit alcohol dehydrogenase family)